MKNILWEVIWKSWRKKIILFDTTLRDWHQCPWAWIEKDEDYFSLVRWLDQIWFDICELWFPSSSKNEWTRVNEAAKMCQDWEISTIVWWLTQMIDFQVESTLRALEPVSTIWKWFFHIYFPVDPDLRKASIWEKISDKQALKDIARFSKLASDMWFIVQFSPEWYSKMWDNFDFCTEMLISAAENWASYFNMPDTIWAEDPNNTDKEYYVETIKRHKSILDKKFPWNNFIWSVHNHNDLWLAVQNSINWLLAWTGISKVEWTINGIWERAWNADLNQIIVRMKTTLSSQFDIDHINPSKLSEVSRLVSSIMLETQAHYPIVWANAMRHTSGWHTNAIIKNPKVYQPFSPKLIWWNISLVYWPNSGWNLAIDIIKKKWYDCPKQYKRTLDEFLKERMKETWRYKWILDKELLELYFEYLNPIKIKDYIKNELNQDGEIEVEIIWNLFWKENIKIKWKTIFKALKNFISQQIPWYSVLNYESKSQSHWSDSIAETKIDIKNNSTWKITTWVWKDNDTELALIKALANAFNKVYMDNNFKTSWQNS